MSLFFLQAMMEKNQRSRMNCVVEKRRAEEIVDHQPHTIRLPFGVNVTTDPRYEHLSGEKMAIYCESGKDQRLVRKELMSHIYIKYLTYSFTRFAMSSLVLKSLHLAIIHFKMCDLVTLRINCTSFR